MPKQINVAYFALLREQRGLETETVETDAQNAAALYDELRAQHGFSIDTAQMMVAVNDDFTTWESALSDGDKVVFLPPVSGG